MDEQRITDKLDSINEKLVKIEVIAARMEALEVRVKELEVDVKSMIKRINYVAGAIAAVLAFVSIVKEVIMKGYGA